MGNWIPWSQGGIQRHIVATRWSGHNRRRCAISPFTIARHAQPMTLYSKENPRIQPNGQFAGCFSQRGDDHIVRPTSHHVRCGRRVVDCDHGCDRCRDRMWYPPPSNNLQISPAAQVGPRQLVVPDDGVTVRLTRESRSLSRLSRRTCFRGTLPPLRVQRHGGSVTAAATQPAGGLSGHQIQYRHAGSDERRDMPSTGTTMAGDSSRRVATTCGCDCWVCDGRRDRPLPAARWADRVGNRIATAQTGLLRRNVAGFRC